MPKLVLPVSEADYKLAGSKFVVIPIGDSGTPQEGDAIALDIECGMPDWDTPGHSVKFPVTITEEGENKGKTDKIAAGVKPDAVWKFKDITRAFGIEAETIIFDKGKVAFDTDPYPGKAARGVWVRRESNTTPGSYYGKLKSIIPAGEVVEDLGV